MSSKWERPQDPEAPTNLRSMDNAERCEIVVSFVVKEVVESVGRIIKQIEILGGNRGDIALSTTAFIGEYGKLMSQVFEVYEMNAVQREAAKLGCNMARAYFSGASREDIEKIVEEMTTKAMGMKK